MSGWGFQRTVKPQRGTGNDDEASKLRNTNSSRNQFGENPSQKVNALMEELSDDIHKFGRRVHKIQQFTKDIGTARDNEKLRSKLKAERSHAAKVNERIQKNINKLSRNLELQSSASLTQPNSSTKDGSSTSNADILDPSSLSHRRQQLKKLKAQAMDMEKQYEEAVKESVTKEKKLSRRPSLEDENGDNDDAEYEVEKGTDDGDAEINPTRSIVREQLKQQQQQERHLQQEHKKKEKEQQQKQIKLLLSSADKSTLELEYMIASETNREIKELERNYLELHECFQDLNTMIKEQDQSFNVILDNLEQANKNVEMGVEDIKISKSMTAVGGIQSLTKKLGTLGKFL